MWHFIMSATRSQIHSHVISHHGHTDWLLSHDHAFWRMASAWCIKCKSAIWSGEVEVWGTFSLYCVNVKTFTSHWCSPCAVVQNGQFSKCCPHRYRCEQFVMLKHIQLPICKYETRTINSFLNPHLGHRWKDTGDRHVLQAESNDI